MCHCNLSTWVDVHKFQHIVVDHNTTIPLATMDLAAFKKLNGQTPAANRKGQKPGTQLGKLQISIYYYNKNISVYSIVVS